MTVEQLCENFPNEFCQFMHYCRNLQFEQRPDYSYLRKLFKDLFYKLGYEYDYIFDWMIFKKRIMEVKMNEKETIE